MKSLKWSVLLAYFFYIVCAMCDEESVNISSRSQSSKSESNENSLSRQKYDFFYLQKLLQEDFAELQKQINQVSELVRSQLPLDCSGAKQRGDWKRITKIKPPELESKNVQCDQFTDGGGWTIVVNRDSENLIDLRRLNDVGDFNYAKMKKITPENFNRTWHEYRNGFGNPDGEYWIGNEILHTLTKERPWEAAVVLEDWSNQRGYAFWDSFRVLDEESSKYRLYISGYDSKRSNLGDGLTYHSGSHFSTIDIDNDSYKDHCAEVYGGGWWFNQCHVSHLTGTHLSPGSEGEHALHWLPWKGNKEALKSAVLMIRPPKPTKF